MLLLPDLGPATVALLPVRRAASRQIDTNPKLSCRNSARALTSPDMPVMLHRRGAIARAGGSMTHARAPPGLPREMNNSDGASIVFSVPLMAIAGEKSTNRHSAAARL
jgi:hypothetical protein